MICCTFKVLRPFSWGENLICIRTDCNALGSCQIWMKWCFQTLDSELPCAFVSAFENCQLQRHIRLGPFGRSHQRRQPMKSSEIEHAMTEGHEKNPHICSFTMVTMAQTDCGPVLDGEIPKPSETHRFCGSIATSNFETKTQTLVARKFVEEVFRSTWKPNKST